MCACVVYKCVCGVVYVCVGEVCLYVVYVCGVCALCVVYVCVVYVCVCVVYVCGV